MIPRAPSFLSFLMVLGVSVLLMASRTFAQSDPSNEELLALLAERDAAIIELQNTVKVMMARLESVEQAVGTGGTAPLGQTATALSEDSAGNVTVVRADEAAESGQTEAFGQLAVDELAAQRALERTLTQRGALLLPAWTLEVAPAIGYSLDEFDDSIVSETERSVLTADLDLRVGMPFDTQLELGLPYRWADESIEPRVVGSPISGSPSRDGSGLGGLRVGIAKTFFRERGWRPDLVGRFTWNTGSGDLIDNGVLVGDFESIGATLSFIKRQDPLVFLGSMGYQKYYSEDGLKPGDQFAFSVGAALAVSPSSSFFTSVSNQFLEETRLRGEDIDGSDFKAITLNLGASTVVARGVLLSLVTGIGVSDHAPDYGIGLSGSVRSNLLRNLRY